MTPFPLGLDAPGRRVTTSSPARRSAVLLLAIIAETLFRGFARFTRRDVSGDGRPDTFCNLFAQDVAEAMGVLLPRYKLANQLIEWLTGPEARAHGWEQVDAHTAQRMADEGQLALACWHSRSDGPGHMAVLVPSLDEPGTWIAQAGKTNFTRGPLASGFGGVAVTYFAHP